MKLNSAQRQNGLFRANTFAQKSVEMCVITHRYVCTEKKYSVYYLGLMVAARLILDSDTT